MHNANIIYDNVIFLYIHTYHIKVIFRLIFMLIYDFSTVQTFKVISYT